VTASAGESLLAGRAIIITGAGRGLGRAYAKHAAAAGAALVVNDLDGEAAELVAAEIASAGGVAVAARHSVSEPADAAALVQLCQDRFGRLDGLVNNAGVRYEDPSWADDPERIRHTVEVNLLGTLYCGAAALAVMHAQRSGVVINASSRAQSGIHDSAVYAATKGAVASLTYSWALDLLDSGVRVNALAPQAQGTGTRRRNEPVSPRDPTPEQIAPLVTFLLSDLSARITGQVIRFGGTRDALSLGLISPPRNGLLLQRPGGWEVRDLAEAFGKVLAAQLEPLGADAVPLAFAEIDDAPLRLWRDETL
jgi:NAD(P)-dependent dehydrogenase (short-subunit alcohol dehydrogenase family)